MKVLHLFANYKWTGPADPAIRCARTLRDRGHDVQFAQAGWTLPEAEHRIAKELWRQRMPVRTGLDLRKHFHLRSWLRDASRLRGWLEQGEPFDALHCHLLADHLIAARALKRLPADRRPLLLRSLYEHEAPKRRWRERLAFAATDGVVVPTPQCAAQLGERFPRFRDGSERVLLQDPPAQLGRSRLQGDLRAKLGAGPEHFLIGITARIQPHRRFELLWNVVARLAHQRPHVRLVLLGRGNAQDTARLVHEPIRALGIEEQVLLPGYLYEPEYSLALRGLDAFLFLVPGSDGTCRAVREVMALGVPVVATPRGILPDLLGPALSVDPDAPCGMICEESADEMAAALAQLVDDPELAQRLGAAARARAEGPMHPLRAAARLEHFIRCLGAARADRG